MGTALRQDERVRGGKKGRNCSVSVVGAAAMQLMVALAVGSISILLVAGAALPWDSSVRTRAESSASRPASGPGAGRVFFT